MLQGHAVQKLHGNERLLAVPADFVDGANMRMVERRRRARLPAKAFQRLRVSRKIIGKEFEGYETAKLRVLRLVNHPHAAAPEFFGDTVMRNCLSDERLGIRHSRVMLG